MTAAELVRALRRDVGLGGRELARTLGTSRMSIWRWEQGHAEPHRIFREQLNDLGRRYDIIVDAPAPYTPPAGTATPRRVPAGVIIGKEN